MDKERRTLQTKIEIRKVENDNGELPYIEGHALKFGTRSENMGGFVEMLSKNCLDNTDMSNVVALYNHNESYPLARNTVPSGAGSLELKVDDTGLYFRLTPTETTYAKDLITNLDAGVVGQCSFAFSLAPSGSEWIWDEDDNVYIRTITAIKRLWDVSIVTTPAYPDTEADTAKRDLEVFKKTQQNELDEVRKRKLAIELELLEG